MAIALKEKRALIGPEAVAERPDGTRVPFLPHPTPIFDSKGEMIGAVNMLIELSEQKRANTRQRGLVDELNHRVKNTLATIQSLAAQTMRDSKNSADRDFEARLMALSRVHDQLTRNTWEWADFADIAGETFAPANDRVCLKGPSVRLNARTALSVAMVLHELARNAEKHGALSTPAGAVTLSWKTEDNRLLIDWAEEGGPPVTMPHKRGFGARLLERSIAHELGGRPKLDFAPPGVHCTMEIPLPE
jgi:two-component sensor histidine kinase